MLLNRNKYKHSSDEELVLFITNKGDNKAFDELYGRYNKALHYFFYRMLNTDKDKADDMLQDLFLKVIEKGHLFDSTKKFSTWLYFIAGNMCKNEYRRIQTVATNGVGHDWEDFAHDSPVHNGHFDKRLFSKDLQKALNGLEEEQRLTFVFRYQQELSIKEIADIMDCAEGTVKSRIFYTLKKLSQQLHHFKDGLHDDISIKSVNSNNTNSKSRHHE